MLPAHILALIWRQLYSLFGPGEEKPLIQKIRGVVAPLIQLFSPYLQLREYALILEGHID
jgi:hypothetical protein